MPIVLRGFFRKRRHKSAKSANVPSMLVPVVLTVLSVVLGMFPSLLTSLLSPF